MFGKELQTWRTMAGWSQRALAKLIPCHVSHVSRIESGKTHPSLKVAARCDELLKAGGALVDAHSRLSRSTTRRQDEQQMERDVPHPDAATLAVYYSMLDRFRELGQQSPPAKVFPLVMEQAKVVYGLAEQCAQVERPPWLSVAARFIEYAGWLAQETGEIGRARALIDRAAHTADTAGDSDLSSYLYVRRALVALYTENSALTVALARQAQTDPQVLPRIRGLAALREAQGHALARNQLDCDEALDRAAALLEDTTLRDEHAPIFGSSTVPHLVDTTAGWCWYDLGNPARAATLLEQEYARIPPTARRARARYGTRLMLAYVNANKLDQLDDLAGTVLDEARQVSSATVQNDLRRLNRTLGRRREARQADEICHRISTLLST